MRERAIATIAIWFSLAISIYLLLERLTYEEYQLIDERVLPDPIVVQAPVFWQIAIFVLILILIIGAFGATYMMWDSLRATPEQQEEANAKLKREQKERVRRLLEQMDSDDLAVLESRISDDGEIVSMEELLEQGELQRRR